MRLSKRDRRILGTAGAMALVLAGIGLALGSLDDGTAPVQAPERPPQLAVATPPPTVVPPEPDKVQERAGPPVAPLQPSQAVEVEPPYIILDGLTFTAGTTTLRLSGLDGPSARTTCRDGSGYPWACGLQARAALNNALRTRAAVCTPTDVSTDGIPHAVCTVEGSDVGERLVAEGWARPSGTSASPYVQALDEARAAGRGLWNGNWTVVEPHPAQDLNAGLRSGMDTMPPQTGN